MKTLAKDAKKYKISQIAEKIGGLLTQNGEDIEITRLSPPKSADENTLALALSEEEIANLAESKAKAAVVPMGVTVDKISTIEVEKPRFAMMKLLHLYSTDPDSEVGIHPSAVVHPEAVIGKNVSIGPNVVICRGASIGDNTRFIANVYVGKYTSVGKDELFYPGVNIGDFATIGDRAIFHHGVSIGADGYSFVTENPNNIQTAKEQGKVEGNQKEQVVFKIPSIGSVTIGNDVEIGANACIDKGTVEDTVIGNGTKIDNLAMIGHNCKVGRNCLIVSQVGVSGSVEIGDRAVLAGQVGIADHVKIGADSIVMAQAGVSKSFPDKSIVVGSPAVYRKEFVKQLKVLTDAQKFIAEFKELKKEIDEFKKGL